MYLHNLLMVINYYNVYGVYHVETTCNKSRVNSTLEISVTY